MTKKITKATPQQWQEIAALKEQVIASMTDQPDDAGEVEKGAASHSRPR